MLLLFCLLELLCLLLYIVNLISVEFSPSSFEKDAEDGDDGGDDDGDDESDNLVDRKHLDALATSWSR